MSVSGSDFQTVLANKSGVTMTFSYLPIHGKTLVNNGTVAIDQLDAYLARNKRKRDAFYRDLAAGNITIVHSPTHFLLTLDTSVTKRVAADLTNGLGAGLELLTY